MSCVLEWEKLAEIAQRASSESVGAKAKVNSKNIELCQSILYKIAKRIGAEKEFYSGDEYDE